MADKWNIIKQMTDGCPREDCKLSTRNCCVSNNAGSSDFWDCVSCGREWSVFRRTTEQTTWDKNGNALRAPQVPPEVREHKRPMPSPDHAK